MLTVRPQRETICRVLLSNESLRSCIRTWKVGNRSRVRTLSANSVDTARTACGSTGAMADPTSSTTTVYSLALDIAIGTLTAVPRAPHGRDKRHVRRLLP